MADPLGTPAGKTKHGRRRFLLGSVVGATLVTLGAVIKVRAHRYPAVQDLALFDAKEYAVLRAVVIRYLGDLPKSADDITRFLDQYLALAPTAMQKDAHQLLFALEHGPQLFQGQFARFTELSPADQDRHLESWAESRFAIRRAGAAGLRELATFGIYRDPASWSAIGYGGPIVPRDYRGSERNPIEPS